MNYQKYADKAYQKLKKYGAPIVVKRAGKKVYNKETNTYIDNGKQFNGVAIQRNYNQKDIDGVNIKFGDVLFMAQMEERPQSNDTVTFSGKTYTIINVSPMNVDGSIDIFVNIQAR